MIRCVALFAFISCALASAIPDKWEGRIINGEDTTIEAHPYQASMQINGFHFCGAAIINNDTAVTAAHCMRDFPASKIKLRFGSTVYDKGGKLVGIRAVRKHNRYNRKTNDFDVAVIKLDTPVRQSSKIRYVKLSTRAPTDGITAVATGWGDRCLSPCPRYPKILQKVYLNIIGRNECRDNYGYSEVQITKAMICASAANKDTCVGDSGGPLVANNTLVGIISTGAGCAAPNYPGVYCNIATVFKWINKTANEL